MQAGGGAIDPRAALTGAPGSDRTPVMKARLPAGTAVIAAGLLVAASAVLMLLSTGIPPMDDTYIHLVYGASLLTSDPVCFNEGQPSSGFTSPLWLPVAAMASRALLAGPVLLMVFSLAAAACAVLAPLPRSAPLLVLTGPFLFHASSGMETALACLLIALSWGRLSKREPSGLDGALLAASGLCRPEFFLLMVPYTIRFIRRGRPLLPGALSLLGPPVLAGSAWVAWNLHATGSPLPASFYAKAGAPVSLGLLGLGLLKSSPLGFVLGMAASVSMLRRGRLEGSIPLLLLAAALSTQPNPWFQMRYYVPVLFASGLACAAWLDGLGTPARRILLPVILLTSLPGLLLYGRNRVLASRDVEAIDVRPALYIRDLADRSGNGTVICADAGAMKWLARVRVLDIDGLVTPPIPAGDLPWTADYAVLFPRQYAEVIEAAGPGLRPLTVFRSTSPVICGEDAVEVFEVVRDSAQAGSSG